MSLQSKIDKIIESKGLTKTALAKAIGVSRDTVYNLNENTKIDTYIKICEYMGVPLSEITDNSSVRTIISGKKSTINVEFEGYETLKIDIKNKKLEILKK